MVGGGFGGLACARALDGADVDVVLIDEENFHLFTPLLYQVATALLDPSDIAYPLRSRFRHSRNVTFRQGRVADVDFEAKSVKIEDGDTLPYDYLVLASGSTNNYFGNPVLARHTIGLRSLAEAMRLRNHVLACLEKASTAESPAERAAWLTFLIVGGGPTGVEYAGALHELLMLVLGRDFRRLTREEARIILVEGQSRLLNGFAESLGRYAERRLGQRGVDVRVGTLVKDAAEGTATLSTGEVVQTRTVVWCAGVRPQAPNFDRDPAASGSHRVEVDKFLRLPGVDGVFAIGDVASVRHGKGELPMLSPPAMQEGRYVAATIRREVSNESRADQLKPFTYFDKGTMATIGRNEAVAELKFLRFKGFIGWVFWLTVHLYFLVGFRNRIVVFWSWGWNYVRRDRPIRIIAVAQHDEIVESLEGAAGDS